MSDAAERRAHETAAVALRLAELLGGLAGDRLADSLPFLRSMAEAAGALATPPPDDPLARLVHGLGLAPVEVDLVLVAGLPEEHEGYAGILRQLHPRGEPFPTLGLALQLLCRTGAERRLLRALLETGAAARARLFRPEGDAPFPERSLRLADRLWPVLCGIDVWPASVEPGEGPIVLGGLETWLAGPAAARAAAAIACRAACTILVTGDSEEVAFRRGAALAASAGAEIARLAVAQDVPAALVAVHALARGVVPVLRLPPSVEGAGPAVAPELDGCPLPVVLCGRTGSVVVRGARPVVAVPVEPLDPSARKRMWSEALPSLAGDAAALAARNVVEPFAAAEAAADLAALEAVEGRAAGPEDVAAVVRARSGLALAGGIKLVRPTATWDDLVLPEDALAQLREAVQRLRHQARVLDEWGFLAGRPGARGVRMLIAGAPGTGKTLSAEVLAHALGADLLLVDIARVVSKWIGETEKNLAEVFDAAERAQAVLFFDEADALFGRRTEVSDAHDRYANLETAYLLMRLERFEGLAVLSTNLRQNVDPAFTRRLEFVVELDEPSAAERELLWRCHLPPGTPLADDVSLADLAALYPVVGGVIRNAAVAAAFLAAANGGVITRDHLVRSIRREYDKNGRAFPGLHTHTRSTGS